MPCRSRRVTRRCPRSTGRMSSFWGEGKPWSRCWAKAARASRVLGSEGHEPRFPELGVEDHDQAVGPVDIATLKANGLTDCVPAGGAEEPDERLDGRGAKAAWDRLSGMGHQGGDVGGRVDEWWA